MMAASYLTLDDPLSANLDPWLAESFDHLERVDLGCSRDFARVTLDIVLGTLHIVSHSELLLFYI